MVGRADADQGRNVQSMTDWTVVTDGATTYGEADNDQDYVDADYVDQDYYGNEDVWTVASGGATSWVSQ